MEVREKISWLQELVNIAYDEGYVHSSVFFTNNFKGQVANVTLTVEFPAEDKSVEDFVREQVALFKGLLLPVSFETQYIDMIRLVKIHFMGIHEADETLKLLHEVYREQFIKTFNKDLSELLSKQG